MMKIRIVLLLSLMLLAACNITINPAPAVPPTVTLPVVIPPTAEPLPPEPTMTPAPTLDDRSQVLLLAQTAVLALKAQDLPALAALTAPSTGLRFSPQAYIKNDDLLFSPAAVSALWTDAAVYTWGSEEGSGAPIEMTFAQYYGAHLFSADYSSAPQISFNQRLGGEGGAIDNSAEFYPGSTVVEYYFPGFDPQYNGMDWRSLRLVFQPVEGRWTLVGLINDQWGP